MPWKVLSPRPSLRDWAKAASRFGPTTPGALARASVWQLAQFWLNSSLPATTLVVLSFTWQPPRASTVAKPPMTSRPLLMGRHPNCPAGRGSRRASLRSRPNQRPLRWTDAPAVPPRRGGMVRDDGRHEPRDPAVRALRARLRLLERGPDRRLRHLRARARALAAGL